jgi:Ser/Thr protein kinase RdoA (MazF antagonist)
VKSFDQLTHGGQIRRLRRLAENALKCYPLDVQKISLVTNDWNGIFRVSATDGQQYMLRVARPEYTVEETRSEMVWLAALAKETDIPVPQPVRNLNSDLVTVASASGVPEPRLCAVFGWLPGQIIGGELSLTMVAEWGRLAARLHEHSRTFTPQEGFTRATYRGVFPFPTDKLVLFDDDQPLMNDSSRREIFRRALDWAEAEIAKLYDGDGSPRLIHNDLHLWNILVHRGRLAAIDFDDIMWGYPVQDVGTALYYVARRDDFESVRAAFCEGYTSVAPWVETYEGQLNAMIAARALNLFNVSLLFPLFEQPDDHARFAARTEALLRRVLDT